MLAVDPVWTWFEWTWKSLFGDTRYQSQCDNPTGSKVSIWCRILPMNQKVQIAPSLGILDPMVDQTWLVYTRWFSWLGYLPPCINQSNHRPKELLQCMSLSKLNCPVLYFFFFFTSLCVPTGLCVLIYSLMVRPIGKIGFIGYHEILVFLIVFGFKLTDIGNGPWIEYDVIFCTRSRHAMNIGNKQASIICTTGSTLGHKYLVWQQVVYIYYRTSLSSTGGPNSPLSK